MEEQRIDRNVRQIVGFIKSKYIPVRRRKDEFDGSGMYQFPLTNRKTDYDVSKISYLQTPQSTKRQVTKSLEKVPQ